LDWPALVVEGDTESTDKIIVAGVPQGMTAINVCASDKVIRLIQKKYGHLLADAIRPLDPRNVIGDALKAKSESVNQTDLELDLSEPNSACTAEENRRQSGAPHFDDGIVDHALKEPVKADLTDFEPDMPELNSACAEEEKLQQSWALLSDTCIVGDHALKAKSGKADFIDVDLDMPEPKSDRAEEEKRRQGSVLCWENGVIVRQDNRLQSNSGLEVREHGTPPTSQGCDHRESHFLKTFG
jgi:hypothetical protein